MAKLGRMEVDWETVFHKIRRGVLLSFVEVPS